MTHAAPHRIRLFLGVVLVAGVAVSGLGAGTGCGYHMVRYGGGIPGANTLAILPLENSTFEPGVETVMLDALRREAFERGGLRLIDDPEAADLVLGGRVKTLSVAARSFTSVVLAVEYEVTLGLGVTVVRSDGEQIPIDPRALIDHERYLASADIEAMRKNRREAIHRLAGVLAARIYDSLYETARAEADSSTATP